MPIYEYYCPENHKLYCFFARSAADSEKIPRCPDDPTFTMQRQVSAFAITGNAQEEDAEVSFDLEDPRMEHALEALERDLSKLDDDNPDPRQLNQFVQRFSELTGQKIPDAIREMMERLERGEDPDALEEVYGDALDDEELFKQLRTKLGISPPPIRDPELYELRDYL